MKMNRKKDFLVIFFILFLITVLIKGTDIQSVDEYYLTHIDDIKEDSKTVYLTIVCDSVLEHMEDLDEGIREMDVIGDGTILARTEYVLRDGDTVYDILDRACRYNKIQMEHQGAKENSFGTVYIKGINYLYEFSCGNLSGWMYKVNGEFPKYGCSRYVLEDGDDIVWVYTCNLGDDIGGSFNNYEEKD